MRTFEGEPLWTLGTFIREVVEPADFVDSVLHYSIPALEASGAPALEDPADIKSQKLLLQGGEVLVSRLNPRKGRVTLVAPSDRKIVASTEFVAVKPHLVDPRFLCYALASDATRQALDAEVRSVTRSHQRVDPSVIAHVKVHVPSLQEQRRIADFLDDQVALLDHALALRQRQTALLEERFLTVVDAAVDPSDSTACRLKYLCQGPGQYGLNVSASDYVDEDGGVRMLRTTDLRGGRLAGAESGIFVSGPIEPKFLLQKGDVLASRAGTVGRAFLVPPEAEHMTYAGFLVKFRARADVDARYLAYSMQSSPVQAQVEQNAVLSTIRNFNAERYGHLVLKRVSLERQRQIADRLDGETESVHHEHELLSRSRSLLVQRKRSLITAAVTGQFDVATAGAVA